MSIDEKGVHRGPTVVFVFVSIYLRDERNETKLHERQRDTEREQWKSYRRE